MLTSEQVESLNLQLDTTDTTVSLLVENALEWVADNTTVEVDINDLENASPSVRLFIQKYIDLMNIPIGISSESATGLSQSFDTTDKYSLLISLASTIFGEDSVTANKVKFVPATKRFKHRRRGYWE